MNDRRSDRELVAAHLGGDRDALAGIYDRYADQLYDTAAAMLGDRHEAADVVQDTFLLAAERLGQLRDPERLRAWLFAILRNGVYRRSARRARTRPVDLSAPGVVEVAAPFDPAAEGERVVHAELAAAVRAAAGGLDARDQLVLELSARQGLTGADLADALGVSPEQSHLLVHRMRQRVERSLGALTVARMGRRDCAELAGILRDWDGTFSVLVRKRVARHIDRCEICERARRRFAVVPLLTSAPAFAAPPELREAVLRRAASAAGAHGTDGGGEVDDTFDTEDGFPRPPRDLAPLRAIGPRGRGRTLALSALAAVLVVAAGLTAVVSRGGPDGELVAAGGNAAATATTAGATTAGATTSAPATSTSGPTPATVVPSTGAPATSTAGEAGGVVTETTTATGPDGGGGGVTPPPSPPPAPGRLVLAGTVVDLGPSADGGGVELTNAGGSPLRYTVVAGAGSTAFTAPVVEGTVEAGAAVEVSFAVDRSVLAEGGHRRRFTIRAGEAGAGDVEVRAAVERAPEVEIVRGPGPLSCPWSVPPLVAARVTDEAAVGSVTSSWSGPGPAGEGVLTSPAPGEWRGQLGIGRVNGTWTYVVRAIDARGNVGSASGTVVVRGC